jgi:hypothetical protein
MTAAQPAISGSGGVSLAEQLRSLTPAILFGLRMWASVAPLWIAFAPTQRAHLGGDYGGADAQPCWGRRCANRCSE